MEAWQSLLHTAGGVARRRGNAGLQFCTLLRTAGGVAWRRGNAGQQFCTLLHTAGGVAMLDYSSAVLSCYSYTHLEVCISFTSKSKWMQKARNTPVLFTAQQLIPPV